MADTLQMHKVAGYFAGLISPRACCPDEGLTKPLPQRKIQAEGDPTPGFTVRMEFLLHYYKPHH